MASGKRASMREGPLAALCRKTEEDGLHGEGVPPQQASAEPRQAEQPQPQAQPREREREEFRSPAGGVHESPVQPPVARQPEPELRPAPPSARKPLPDPVRDGDAERERRERRAARTPEQRLREVFS